MIAAALVLVLAATTMAAPAAPTQLGYVVSTRWFCAVAGCLEWELQVARVTVPFVFKDDIVTLSTLLPKTKVQDTNFLVVDAYNNLTRAFYVAGETQPKTYSLWTLAINDNVTAAVSTSNTTFTSPNGEPLVRIQAVGDNALLGIFADGRVYFINNSTGATTHLGDLFSIPALQQGTLSPGSAIDYDNELLYAIASDRFGSGVAVITMDLNTGVSTVQNVTIRKIDHAEKWGQENLFNAVWIPYQQLLYVFAEGTSLGFDQILTIDPKTGNASFPWFDLAETSIEFETDTGTKVEDNLQLGCYDPFNQLIYFQGEQLPGGDDDTDSTTTVFYLELHHPDIDPTPVISPFDFGFIGFNYVPIIN